MTQLGEKVLKVSLTNECLHRAGRFARLGNSWMQALIMPVMDWCNWKVICVKCCGCKISSKSKTTKVRRERASLQVPREIPICLGEKHEVPFKPSDPPPPQHPSFLPEWDSRGYGPLESLLGATVMAKFRLSPVQFSLFCYLLGVLLGRAGGLAQLLFHYHIFWALRRKHEETHPNYRKLGREQRLHYTCKYALRLSHQAHTYRSLSKYGFRTGGQGYDESTRREGSKARSFRRGLTHHLWGNEGIHVLREFIFANVHEKQSSLMREDIWQEKLNLNEWC